MPLFGKIIVIKRNGTDGTHFPLTASSCLFGRKRECDIRIQLPQVSKEHCKIEINENKEATLINLSTVNPTQLNGSIFQNPTCLKHGDVLTITDRSFRFEYPPLSVPQKRLSRLQEKETLQVLHVQQVEQEELLHPQNSEYKSLQTPDKKLVWESQDTNGSNEQRAEEYTIRQYGNPESTNKICKSNRKKEMSPFSKLYELMKHEGEAKTAEDDLSNETSTQPEGEYSHTKHGNNALLEAVSQTPHRRSAVGQAETEAISLKKVEHPTDIENQEIKCLICNPVSVEGNISRLSSASLQTCAANVASEETNQLNLQNIRENELGKSEESKNDVVLRPRKQSAKYFPESCCVVSLEYSDRTRHPQKIIDGRTETADVEIKTNLRDTLESENILPSSESQGKNVQTYSSPHSRKANRRSSSQSRMLQVEPDSLLELKRSMETSAETETILHANTGEHESDIFIENTYFKTQENKVLAIEQPLDAQSLKETKNEIFASDMLTDGSSGTIVSSLRHSNSKSPRRSIKQNKEFSNGSYFTEMLTTEASLITPTDPSPGRDIMKMPNQLSEENVGQNWPQENDDKLKKGSATESHEQNIETKYNTQGLSNLTESSAKMPAEEEAVSDMSVLTPLSGKSVSGVKKSPLKRKRTGLDLINQPLGKRKRVSFGRHLSPELFDKRLPPNSPLKKGAIPARLSLPFGNSPRAVLKKASGFRQSAVKDFSERMQHENILPPARRSLAASPPARRSPAASPPARRSPAASPPARRSPAASPPARRSPAASPPARRSPAASPPARRSPAASPPARRSPAASPPARRSPAASPPARRSPAASPPARRSPAASPPARRSPAASPPARRSPAASPPARRSPAASPPARRSPATSPPARRSPATSPPARRSPATSPSASLTCDFPSRKGRFSISRVTSPSSSVEKDVVARVMHVDKDFIEAKTPEPSEQEPKVPQSIRRSKKFAPKRTSLSRRSGVMDTIHSRRRSGASEANLIVAKSWAEVVKQGVPKSPLKTFTKCGFKKSTKKIPATQPKKNVSLLKTPTKKVKGHFTTGHANSPAPIVIGKAHTSVVKVAAQVPKVMFNYPLKQRCDLNESFTGVAEMFNTPLNLKQKNSLSVQKVNVPAPEDVLEPHTPEESGEMSDSPINLASQQKCPLLSKISQISNLVEDKLQMIPQQENTVLEETVRESSSLVTAINETTVVAVQDKRKSSKPVLEPAETLSAVKRLLRTPKQKSEPADALSAIKRLMRTPKQKSEPAEVLSAVKRLMRTPKQKLEPAEALSAVKRLMRTPKQKSEPAEALSAVKRLMRTPKQKLEPAEALSAVKRLMRTPKQKSEPAEALSAVKRLMRTPKQKLEPAEAITRDVSTQAKTEPIEDEITCSRFLKIPEDMLEEPMGSITKRTQKQRTRSMERNCINDILKAPKGKIQPVEDVEGIQGLLRIPKQRFEPVEDMIGISRLLKTPKQKFVPVDDFLGLQKLMAEPKHSCLSPEIDYTGVKEMLDAAVEHNQEPKPEASFERKSLVTPSNNSKRDPELEDSLRHGACRSLDELKIRADVGLNEILCAPDGMNLQNEVKIDSVKKPAARQRSPVAIDVDTFEPLVSAIRTRRKVDKSIFTDTPNTKMTLRHARSAKCMQTNKNSDQNITETHPAEESEIIKRPSRGTSRRCSAETNGSIESDNVRQTQELMEPLKETSVKIQVPVNRKKVAVKRHEQTEVSIDLEETAATQENGNQLITKTSQRSKNGKDKQNELTSEFIKPNPQDKMQNKGLEISGMECVRNCLLKRNARKGRAIQIQTGIETLNTTTDEDKCRSVELTAPISHEMESDPLERKEMALRKGRGRRTHFLQQKDPVLLEENCVLGDEGSTHEDKKDAFLELCTHFAKESTSRGSKRKIVAFASEPITASLSTMKHAFAEVCEDEEGICLPLENIVLAKEDQAIGSSSFVQGKCSLQKIQNEEENPNQAQKVHLEKAQAAEEHSSSRRQKVTQNYPPKRGRSKQTTSQETPTEYGSKEAGDIKDKNLIVGLQEKPSKRGRGKRITPASQAALLLENIAPAKEDQAIGSFSFVQGKCSLQKIQNEENPNQAQQMPLEIIQTTEEHKKETVAKENPPRRGRSKQTTSQETPTEYGSKEAGDVKDKHLIVAQQGKPSKRGRGKKITPVSQAALPLENIALSKEDQAIGSSSFVQGKCSLQNIQNEEGNANQAQQVFLEIAQTTEEHKKQTVAKENPPRRGRSKQATSQETPTEYGSKEAGDVKDKHLIVAQQEKPSKRGRGKEITPVSQAALPLENIAVAKENPAIGSSSFVQGKCSLQKIQNEEGNATQAQKVHLEKAQAAEEHSSSKRQKVTQDYPPRRGRSKKAISQETPTEYGSKEAGDIKDKNLILGLQEKPSKRGRGKRITPASQAALLLENIAPAKEDQAIGSSSFVQGKCSLQKIQNEEENPNQAQQMPLEIIQTTEEHKKETVAKENPPRRGRSKQTTSQETPTEYGSKEAGDVKDKHLIVAQQEKPSKRGRGKEITPVSHAALPLENIAVAKENPAIGSSSFVQGKCSLQKIQNEEGNADQAQKVPLENAQAAEEHSSSKRQKVTQDYPPRRARSKKAISHETSTEYGSKEANNIEDQNMLVKSAFSTKKNQSKRGRGRNITPISQTLISPLKNDTLSLPLSTNGKSVKVQNATLETATTANENLPRWGRRRKTDDVLAACSISVSKKPRLLDNSNQEKMPKELQDVAKDNVSKQGRRKVVPYKISMASDGKLGDDSKKATRIKTTEVPLENGSENKNQPKKSSRRKDTVLVSQVPPSLKVSFVLPSSPLDSGGTGSENQIKLAEKDFIEKETLEKSGGRNKILPCPTSARRKDKHNEEEVFQEKQNVDLEKTSVSNEKRCRRGRRKADGPEVTVSFKEKHGLSPVGGDVPKDEQEILETIVSDMKDPSKDKQQKVLKGKSLSKNTDQGCISNIDQNSQLGLSAFMEKENSSKRGTLKQINREPETSATPCDMKKSLLTEKKSRKRNTENTESTTLQKGKKKMKEEHTTAVAEPAAEMEGKTRASRRTRK